MSKKNLIAIIFPELRTYAVQLLKLGVPSAKIAKVIRADVSTIRGWRRAAQRGELRKGRPRWGDERSIENKYLRKREKIIRKMHVLLDERSSNEQ